MKFLLNVYADPAVPEAVLGHADFVTARATRGHHGSAHQPGQATDPGGRPGIHRSLPDDGEVAGLLALMLLTDARRAARTDAAGGLVPLAEQDRTRWDGDMIEEGTPLVTDAMLRSPLGPYQLQAAIASLHVQAPRAADTDWRQIRFLYQVLCRIAPNPMATLNHAIAVAMTDGPDAGLAMLSALAADDRMACHHRLTATRAHLLELAGDAAAARESYLLAARRTTSLPEQRYLRARADRLPEGRRPR